MNITEEQRKTWNEIKETWYKKAESEINTVKDLSKFADDLINHLSTLKDGSYLYEETVYGASALGYAAIQLMSYTFGMTGFQMSCIMWELIKKLHLGGNEVGMRLLSYDDMLYPQYSDKFQKIPKWAWEGLQKEASRKLKEVETKGFETNDDVVKHWKSIVDGNVPFGYEVDND